MEPPALSEPWSLAVVELERRARVTTFPRRFVGYADSTFSMHLPCLFRWKIKARI